MRVLVTGASGLVGRRLVAHLGGAGHAVVATSRDPARLRLPTGAEAKAWDGLSAIEVPGRLDAIVHLAGDSIAEGRWTAAKKERLRSSRIASTRRLVDLIGRRAAKDRPVLVCANAVGYYGIAPPGKVTEESPPGADFLATLCRDWEAEARKAKGRVVVLRVGHVLARDGGYLGKMLPFSRLGLAGPLGSGRQPLPWVHVDDVAGAFAWAIAEPAAAGAYNLVAPQPATQGDLVRALNRALLIPSLIPLPGFVLRARFGDLARSMLGGQDADPSKIRAAGYRFRHPDLGEAVESLLRTRPAGGKA